MTATQDDTIAELQRANAELRRERHIREVERDAALARQAALAEELAARDATLAQRNTEYSERIEQQSATVDVLKVMSASPGDPKPVFDLITRRAAELCNSRGASIFEYDGELVHVRSRYHSSRRVATASAFRFGTTEIAQASKFYAAFPMKPERGVLACRAILDRQIIHIRDTQAEPQLLPIVRDLGIRSILAIPLLREDNAVGAFAMNSEEPGGFTESQVALLQTFAEQAVIAITSAETYRALQERTAALAARNSEYGERIEQQSATIDVLKVMSSSPGNAQPVFELIVERARAFCGADQCTVALLDGDMLHLKAKAGMSEASARNYAAQFPRPVNTASMFGRAILAREAVQTPDVSADPEHFSRTRVGGPEFRAIVAVPMLRAGTPIGAIALGRKMPGVYSATQMELLQTFAEQAVIAITSAETYRALQTRTGDLQQSLEYQTATSDVLKVISRSAFDLQPVLDTVVETAARLCDADMAGIGRREGELVRGVAFHGYPPEYRAWIKSLGAMPLDRHIVGHRAALEGRVVHVHDVAAEPNYPTGSIALGKMRTSLGVPLLREGETVGSIVLARQRVEPFTDRQIELVSTFADQAVIAIENTRLLTEQREALEQQTATAEVLQVINNSPGNLAPVFDAMLEKAMRLCDTAYGIFATYDGDAFLNVAWRGVPPALVQREEFSGAPIRPRLGALLYPLMHGEDVVHVADIKDDEFYRSGNRQRRALVDVGGARTVLEVALRKDNTLLGAINVFRQEVHPFTDKQIALLQTFAAQAVIAIENARLITEQQDALEQQTATAEVLQVINASPGNLTPVFEAILEKAHSLCDVAVGSLSIYLNGFVHTAATRGFSEEYQALLRPPYPAIGSHQALMRGGQSRQTPDFRALPVSPEMASSRYHLERMNLRTGLWVPLRKDGTALGCISSYRDKVQPFSEKEIALLENFAAQAVIAMENARLLTEQQEALEQQTATADVLRVINASPGDLTPVFDAILDKAHSLCGATVGNLAIYKDGSFHAVATHGFPEQVASLMLHPSAPNAYTRELIHGERFHQIEDIRAIEISPQYLILRALVEYSDVRTVLFVPLRKDGALLGFISVNRPEVRPFSEKEIALLENFAAQAVIAMENARLLNEQREALEQQTATAEVLGVINASPGNLVPVFDAILEKAMRLCEAGFGSLYTYDGDRFQSAAQRGVSAAYAAYRERRPPELVGEVGLDEVIRTRRAVQVTDMMAERPYLDGNPDFRAMVDLGGMRTAMVVPLCKDETALGVISVFRQEVRPFSDKQIALLENFAAQAVIAMENARLLNELRARTDELAQRQAELRITFENMGDGVAMFDETQYLAAWNRKFQDILDLPDALLGQHRTYEEHLLFLAGRGDFGPGIDTVEQINELVASTGQPYGYERTRPDGRVIEIRRNPVPDGGFVLIYSDITERKRSEEEIRAARDAAETALRELKIAQANLIQAEKMASLGQLTAGIAHEIKNPLNFVNNFAALSVDLLGELKETAAPGFAVLSEKQRAEVEEVSVMLTSNLEKITEHGKRADGIVKAMLEHSRGSSGERRMVDLNTLIDEALNLAYHGARAQDQSFNITLERDFGEAVAPIEVNPQDITRVFLNLFANGFYATTKRAHEGADARFAPTLKVTTREADEAVEIRVRDNGTGIPADIRDKLFQPFFTTKPTGEGTGLGLSITYDIVTQQHGGNIAVDSKVGEYSEFTIRLPRKP